MRRHTIEAPPGSVAVIGMAGRFPGAHDVDEFWKNLADGRETITHFTREELLRSGIPASAITDPDYVYAQGVLEGIEQFDAAFFGFTPAEAAITAPEHRLLLECAWQALESSGNALPGQRVGVFAGVGFNTYLQRVVLPQTGRLRGSHLLQALLGNEKDQVTSRIAYKLDLRGPSITVQTGCSTSLVAVHLACQSLMNGECDLALAGGATVSVPQNSGYLYQEGGTLSPDGHCRAFDADAKGTVPGNGAAIVVLKRADDALADRDVIYAFIRGTAVNNDGAEKIGYTAPGPKGQAAVIAEALAIAGVDPGTIGYIETNGTATVLGDPIEINALMEAYRGSKTGRHCAIGSVKSSVGHLGAAAGVTGLIKAVLALKERAIPASLHYKTANPEINFPETPFFVNTELLLWPAGEEPRRAAVSAFGIGGTNAHVVLEEAPELESEVTRRPHHLLVLSAKYQESLNALSDSFTQFLKRRPSRPLADIAYTLQTGRRAFPYRRTLVCSDTHAAEMLLSSTPQQSSISAENGAPSVAFLFPGQGAQYVDMSREIYETEPGFRARMDYCADFLKGQLDTDLRSILYPDRAGREDAARQLDQTHISQPALFVVEYALAMLWMEWGIQPAAMIGHGIGEYTAACVAGVFSLEDALTLVAARGRLMQLLPPDAMLTVSSHSAVMDPILSAFEVEVMKTKRKPPGIPYVSTVTGDWIKPEQAVSSEYWAEHLRQTVRFREGQKRLEEMPCAVFLEVGPGQTLSTLVHDAGLQSPPVQVVTSMRNSQENVSDAEHLMQTLGLLWRSGVDVDWRGYWKHETRNRVQLPTHPFQRQRHWIDPLQNQALTPEPIPLQDASVEDVVEQQLLRMADQLQAMAEIRSDVAESTNRAEVPVNAIQTWFFDQDLTEPSHVNHSVQLEMSDRIDLEVARIALLAVVESHEVLRTQYRNNSAGWYAVIAEPDDVVRAAIEFVTLRATDGEAEFISAKAKANRSLDLRTGPLMRLLLFDCGDTSRQRLLLICHHLVVDVFSWATIINDLEIAFTQLSRGRRVLLPSVPCSYGEWTRLLRQYARSPEALEELPYWLSSERSQARGLPVDHAEGSNTEGSSSVVDVRLTIAETEALLGTAPRVYESPRCDIFLTAMSAALIHWAGGPVVVDIEGHGREDLFPDLELSRTVGWLTAIYPLLLDVPNTVEPAQAIRRMRDKRQDVPLGGIGFGLLRYLSGDAEIVHRLSALPPAQISFNYEEQPHSSPGRLFTRKSLSSSVSPLNRRTHLLNVQIGVREKQFYTLLGYSADCHQRKTIEDLGAAILDKLREFVEYAAQHHPAEVASFSNCSGR